MVDDVGRLLGDPLLGLRPCRARDLLGLLADLRRRSSGGCREAPRCTSPRDARGRVGSGCARASRAPRGSRATARPARRARRAPSRRCRRGRGRSTSARPCDTPAPRARPARRRRRRRSRSEAGERAARCPRSGPCATPRAASGCRSGSRRSRESGAAPRRSCRRASAPRPCASPASRTGPGRVRRSGWRWLPSAQCRRSPATQGRRGLLLNLDALALDRSSPASPR